MGRTLQIVINQKHFFLKNETLIIIEQEWSEFNSNSNTWLYSCQIKLISQSYRRFLIFFLILFFLPFELKIGQKCGNSPVICSRMFWINRKSLLFCLIWNVLFHCEFRLHNHFYTIWFSLSLFDNKFRIIAKNFCFCTQNSLLNKLFSFEICNP